MLKDISRTHFYTLMGVLLGLGSPVGALALRWWLSGAGFSDAWLQQETHANSFFYLYQSIGTISVFGFAGFLVGQAQDRLERFCVKLEETGLRDPLTGLFNRRSLLERLEQEMARSSRHHSPLSCLGIDVDNLRAINEQYGYSVGDQILKTMAARLVHVSRSEDIVTRVGGDSFVVVLPDTDLRIARQIAERIKEDSRHLPVQIDGKPTMIHINVGIAERTPGMTGGEQLFTAVDYALFDARRVS